MRSLILALAFTLGCGLQTQDDTAVDKMDQASKPNPIPVVINGSHATLYRYCDGTNLIYYAEGSYKVALEVIKEGCNGR